MLRSEYEIDKDTYLHREELKEFYKTPTGIQELKSLILLCGVLSDITDSSQVTAHNICIRKLEEIGLLDEESLEGLLIYMLNQPSEKRPKEEEF